MRRYLDKVVVITGASSGIGAALASELAREGALLVLAGRRADKLEAVAMQCGGGARALTVTTDVSKTRDLENLVAAAVAKFGHIDVLVNNAGVPYAGSLTDLRPDEIAYAVSVNLTAPIVLTHLALPALRAEAQIINVASMSGLIALPAQNVYCATKFGMRGFSEALRRELHGTTVCVSTVFPGVVASDMTPPEFQERARELAMPMRPMPTDVAARRIVAGMRRARPWIVIATSPERMMWWLHDRWPRLFDALAARLAPRIRAVMVDGLKLFRARHSLRP